MPEEIKEQLYAKISANKLKNNINIFKNLNPNKKIIAITKANAYGHGEIDYVKAVLKAGADSVGTTTIDEALELRKNNINAPILVWLLSNNSNFEQAILENLNIAVSDEFYLDKVLNTAKKINKKATISLKIDTGLNRNGFRAENIDKVITKIQNAVKNNFIEFSDVFSHLSHAEDADKNYTLNQIDKLIKVINMLKENDLHPKNTHIANSALSLEPLKEDFNSLRIGFGLYGYNPYGLNKSIGLKPILSLHSEVLLVKNIKKGEGVSYDHQWVANKDTTIALIAGGYADGINRKLTNKIKVKIKEKSYQQIGRVCMDQILVDLGSNYDEIKIGDEVTLFENNDEFSVINWANTAETNVYEILCNLSNRITRIYTT